MKPENTFGEWPSPLYAAGYWAMNASLILLIIVSTSFLAGYASAIWGL